MSVKKLMTSLIAAAALAGAAGAQAQVSDYEWERAYNAKHFMTMASKDGMVSKADVMKMVGEKFDKMATNGMINSAEMRRMLLEMYRGG